MYSLRWNPQASALFGSEDIYIAKAGKPVIGYVKQYVFEDILTKEEEVRKAFSGILQRKEEMDRLYCFGVMEQCFSKSL